MKPSLHSLIIFLLLFCICQLSSIASSYPDRVTPRNSTLFYVAPVSFKTLLHNHFAKITQKTQTFCCWKGVLTAPLRSNGSTSIAACAFVAARMCLPIRCLTMNVYSDFAIPAFGRHVTVLTIYNHRLISFEDIEA
jgi:hypothetical protein